MSKRKRAVLSLKDKVKQHSDFFVDELKEFLNGKEYDLDFVYNADETGLNWKALTSKSLASRHENAAPRHKSNSSIILHDDFKEITEAMEIVSVDEGYDEENIKEWLNYDSGDPGFQILTF
ncbi:unnamed protein product [Parnassius apollo]|uniref:(apollo) hypothetical protein n=1 Tax=Parnassius apollo TaxID=110799 RepID=A0A8S3WA54_PARAO|nr:unnamed protein product [Parnassius apollo]